MCEPTPRVRWVLERARQEAREHGHDYVGTEHLLLALLADEDGIAKEVLATHADPAALRAAVEAILASEGYNTPSRTIIGRLMQRADGSWVERAEMVERADGAHVLIDEHGDEIGQIVS